MNRWLQEKWSINCNTEYRWYRPKLWTHMCKEIIFLYEQVNCILEMIIKYKQIWPCFCTILLKKRKTLFCQKICGDSLILSLTKCKFKRITAENTFKHPRPYSVARKARHLRANIVLSRVSVYTTILMYYYQRNG